MLAYYLPNTNTFTIRTENTASNELNMFLEDMYTLQTSSYHIGSYTYQAYENLLTFDLNIVSASVGSEYRATLIGEAGSIWRGSIQVYTSQSIDKPNYTNQIPLDGQYKSNVTQNKYTEYIIM